MTESTYNISETGSRTVSSIPMGSSAVSPSALFCCSGTAIFKYRIYSTPEPSHSDPHILLAVVGGLLSVWLGELTHINYAILGLVLGVIFTQLGVVPKNLLQKAQASGFINMVVFAAIIPVLANISISDLIDLILPLVVVFAVSVLSIFVMMKVLPVWKILGDKSMAFGVGFCQMLGFPSTYLISVEVCNAVAEDEDEKAFLMSRVMPRLVVGGMAAMVSILVAGVMAGTL